MKVACLLTYEEDWRVCLTSELAVLKSLKRKKYGKASLKKKKESLYHYIIRKIE